MKVGVVTTSYPRFPDDPAGNFVGEHVRALRSLGHEVEVIAAGDGAHRDARVIGAEDSVQRIPSAGLFYAGGAPDMLERDPRRRWAAARFSIRLTAAVVRRRWDSIIAHWLAPSALACLPTTAPLLVIAHGGDVHLLRRAGLLAPTLHLLRARDAHLVFVSEELRSIALAAAPRLESWLADAVVQPMGIDVARFAAIPRRPTSPPMIAIASRLVPVKGVDVAVAAIPHVTRCPRLVIAGDGPEIASLQQAARTLAPRVELRGAIDTRTRDHLFAEASIVLVPSRVVNGRTEGTPLVALEALAAGIPVIASDVGGLRELDAVVRVPPEDPRALAAAIDRVLDAPPNADVLRASVAHLDWRHVIGKLVRSA